MPLQNIPLTKADFDQAGWQAVIAGVTEKEYWRYASPFFAKAREAAEANDAISQEVFSLLGVVTAPWLRPDADDGPFSPADMLDNISDTHLDVLAELIPVQPPHEVADAELRARIADVLWSKRRDFRRAFVAVDAYLESAAALEDPREWTQTEERLHRAIQIAAPLGRNGPALVKTIAHIEAVLDKYDGEDPLFLTERLMQLLLQYQQGDPTKYVALAEKAAARAEADHDWRRAREYWAVKARWHARQQDAAAERAAQLAAAETHAKEAEEAANATPPEYLRAVFALQAAIEALRRIGNTRERVAELHRYLLTYQRQSVDQMEEIAVPWDEALFEQAVAQAKKNVQGRPLHEALFILAVLSGASPSVSKLRASAEALVDSQPLHLLFGGFNLNELGQNVARQPSILSDDPADREALIRIQMLQKAAMSQTLRVQGFIGPALQQISSEHSVRLSDLRQLVTNNPFVPEGREEIYARGLRAGLVGDWLTAAHLLIPQLEQSIRHVLTQQGVITSGLDDQAIQDAYLLGALLNRPEMKEIFGEDIVFDLQGLLQERYGSNLRNRLAHGLLSYEQIFSTPVVYLWWLMLRLCHLPFVTVVQEDQATPAENAAELTEEGEESSQTEE